MRYNSQLKINAMIDREKLQKDWAELNAQDRELQIRMQRIELAMRSKQDELAEVFLKDDLAMEPMPNDGKPWHIADKEYLYTIEFINEWLHKLSLKEKKLIKDINAESKDAQSTNVQG